jgi:hypothetical protein
LLAIALSLPAASCGAAARERLQDAEGEYRADYALAVIRTSDYAGTLSYIDFYDSDLRLLRTITYPYTWLDDGIGNNETVRDGRLWLIPHGPYMTERDRKVISLDLATGAVREYFVDIVAIDYLAVGPRHFYVSNNLNGVGHVARGDIETGEVEYRELGWSADHIYSDKDGLHIFWNEHSPVSPQEPYGHNLYCLSRFDSEFEVAVTYDLTEDYGEPSAFSQVCGSDFYFTTTPIDMTFEKPDGGWVIRRYSMADSSISPVATPQGRPLYLVATEGTVFSSYWFVNVAELVQGQYYFDAWDTETGDLRGTTYTNYRPDIGTVSGDSLYMGGLGLRHADNTTDFVITRYRIADGLPVEEARVVTTLSNDYHVRTLFCPS